MKNSYNRTIEKAMISRIHKSIIRKIIDQTVKNTVDSHSIVFNHQTKKDIVNNVIDNIVNNIKNNDFNCWQCKYIVSMFHEHTAIDLLTFSIWEELRKQASWMFSGVAFFSQEQSDALSIAFIDKVREYDVKKL